MTIVGQRLTIDEADIQIGVAVAHGLSLDKTAVLTGMHRNTIHQRRDTTNVKHIAAVARTIIAQIPAQLTEDIAERGKKRMREVFDRSFTLSEKLLQKAEDAGDDVSIDMLMEIHKHLTVWSSKHVVAPLPTKMEVESTSTSTHLHVHAISLDDAANILATRQLLKPPPLQLGEVSSQAVPDGA